jgi:plastocyanin
VSVPNVPSLPAPNAAPNAPAAGTRIVAGPQAQFYGYLTPAVVVTRGGKVIFSNVDLVRHNVVQNVAKDGVHGDGSAPWCASFPAGKCPLFYSPLEGLEQNTTVLGVDNLKPGRYSFYCAPHPGMKGILIVR